MTNEQVIKRFITGATEGKNTNGSLFISGNQLFSYGPHYVLAERRGDKFWVNTEAYSKTTSKQATMVRSMVPAKMLISQ